MSGIDKRPGVGAYVYVMAALAVITFVVAAVVSQSIPISGDPKLVSLVSAFVAFGSTLAAAAVAVAAVRLTLNLQREAEAKARWTGIQADSLRQANDWVGNLLRNFEEVASILQSHTDAAVNNKPGTLAAANLRAQVFYDDQEMLQEVVSLMRLIDAEAVVSALREASAAVENWNSVVARNYPSRPVDMRNAASATRVVHSALVKARDDVLEAYAEAFRQASTG
jgi:hypothetical protein